MKLKRIAIRNFRLLRRVNLELAQNAPTTVLVGPNNSGKTSVMEAIRLMSSEGKRLQIYDFAQARRFCFKLAEERLNAAVDDEGRIEALRRTLPVIRLSLTFEYDDKPEDLNLVARLLMDLALDSNEVTIRVEFAIADGMALWKAYENRRKPDTTTLFDVLSESLHSYYGSRFLKVSRDGKKAELLDDNSIIDDLISVNIIPAQRHVEDEETAKAARLSRLLHDHYTTYIRGKDEETYQSIEDAIRESSAILTDKYEIAFDRLLRRLRDFGYPPGNAKPQLTIKAEMSSQTIYRDSTKIYYAAPSKHSENDEEPDYELPERYNGLGFKNLIYIILKLESFRAAVDAESARAPGVHLIGIEEPEAHLHPQMQSVFIKEISRALEEDTGPSAQVIMSTHSPHMVADSGFSPIRYFKRNPVEAVVKDLSRFPIDGAIREEDKPATLAFLRRYIKLTHCDLLFADKAILVEGQVEKLLLPVMIERVGAQPDYEGFLSQYVSILEIGGAYAHKIEPFLTFLGLPTLVITDLDSAKSDRTKCPVSEGVITTNGVIAHWLKKNSLAELHSADDACKTIRNVRIAYQIPENGACGRSFEEAFVYANPTWIVANKAKLTGVQARITKLVADGIIDGAYDFGLNVEKVDLALDLMAVEGWAVPAYIEGGLKWLALQRHAE